MTATDFDSENVALWTRLACSRCRYRWEHPGAPTPADLDRDCPLCRGGLGAVTVYRLGAVGNTSTPSL